MFCSLDNKQTFVVLFNFGWSFQNLFRVKSNTNKLNCIVFADELPVPHIQKKRSTSGTGHSPAHSEGQYYYLPAVVDVYEYNRKIGIGTLRDSVTVLMNPEFIRNFNAHFKVSYREPFTEKFFYRDVSGVNVRPVQGSSNNNERRRIVELHLNQSIPRQRVLNPYYFPELTNQWNVKNKICSFTLIAQMMSSQSNRTNFMPEKIAVK